MKIMVIAVLFTAFVSCTNNAADSKPSDLDNTNNNDTANKKTNQQPTDSIYTLQDSVKNR